LLLLEWLSSCRVLAAHTIIPVKGIPIKSSTFDGLDALLSTVMMPKGIPVAAVAVNGAGNAAILAAQMLRYLMNYLHKAGRNEREYACFS
jgi:phosphoribosylaminoimidazole carboxylase PurE protein